jgi:hypothetical protein
MVSLSDWCGEVRLYAARITGDASFFSSIGEWCIGNIGQCRYFLRLIQGEMVWNPVTPKQKQINQNPSSFL